MNRRAVVEKASRKDIKAWIRTFETQDTFDKIHNLVDGVSERMNGLMEDFQAKARREWLNAVVDGVSASLEGDVLLDESDGVQIFLGSPGFVTVTFGERVTPHRVAVHAPLRDAVMSMVCDASEKDVAKWRAELVSVIAIIDSEMSQAAEREALKAARKPVDPQP